MDKYISKKILEDSELLNKDLKTHKKNKHLQAQTHKYIKKFKQSVGGIRLS